MAQAVPRTAEPNEQGIVFEKKDPCIYTQKEKKKARILHKKNRRGNKSGVGNRGNTEKF